MRSEDSARPSPIPRVSTAMILALWSAGALADVCTVPGTHASLWAAVDDVACSEIDLAAQTYPESISIDRSLALVGPGGGGAVLAGLLEVRGAGVVVTAADLDVENGCQPVAATALDGARLEGSTLHVVVSSGGPCPALVLFQDGFESGDLGAWDVSPP
jgi:hypothetical protein